ncbi:MAG: chemotaxis protein [Thermodesulfobacteriota bacterium]
MSQQSSLNQSKILLEVGTNELEVITFYLEFVDPNTGKLTKNAFGINAAKVRELVALPDDVTDVINSPDCVKGVFLLRDATIPLVDISEYFGFEVENTPEFQKKCVVIVAELNGKAFGFISHGVDKVHRISWSQITPPPEIIAANASITGICLLDGQTIQMVDFEKITADIDPSMMMRSDRDEKQSSLIEDKYSKEVVVADDSRVILMQLSSTLQKAGFHVKAHPDGLFAWEYLEGLREAGELDEKVLAIISDIEMPRMDGHHFCIQVRKSAAYSKIPIILFSSMINDALRKKGVAVGADDQVTKPELDTLIERLEQCVSRRNPEYDN